MAWIYLIIAGLFEVVWAVGIKYTESFTKLWPSIITILAMILSMGALGMAVRTLPLGTAYAIWTGIGVLGTAVFGILWLNEPTSLFRILSLAALLLGMIGLKLTA